MNWNTVRRWAGSGFWIVRLQARRVRVQRAQTQQSTSGVLRLGLCDAWSELVRLVRYCRWLSDQLGYAAIRRPTADPASLPAAEYERDRADGKGGIVNWPVDLEAAGFRLPTEHEWEAGCRGGMRTAFSFGGDASLLGYYGWYEANSGEQSHVPAVASSDACGACLTCTATRIEWCHDWDGRLRSGVGANGTCRGHAYRVLRGGSWGFAPRIVAPRYRAGLRRPLAAPSSASACSAVPSSRGQHKNQSRRSQEWRLGAERRAEPAPAQAATEGVAEDRLNHSPGAARSRGGELNLRDDCILSRRI